MQLARIAESSMFSLGSGAPRNNQKYSDGSQGLFIPLAGKLRNVRTQAEAISMAKQITITIEANSLLVLQVRNACRRWCPRCAAESDTVAIGGADAPVTLQALGLEWLSSGAVHHFEMPEGSEMICLRSLLNCARKLGLG